MGIKLIGFVDVAHHHFCLGGVSHERNATGGFDLVDNPVPVCDAFKGHWCAGGIILEEIPDGTGRVIDPYLLEKTSFIVENGELRELPMSVTTNLVIRRAAPPSLRVVGIQLV